MQAALEGGKVDNSAPHRDLRNYDLSNGGKVFICNADHPWSGKREDTPGGVRHADAVLSGNNFSCPQCGAKWERS